ncbi:MAG TPA: DUF6491 family protein [Rhizomicrobium sp.]|nr:DUF6491 family protein [Rhizomicrobium sp.]
MTRYLFAAVFLFSAVPAMAQPAPQPPSGPACLRQINMYDFKPVPGNRALIVIGRDRQRYRVNFIGQCYDLQYPMGLRFKTRGTSNLSCVSKGDQVLFHDPASPGICMIRDVQYQTPAMDQQDAAAAAAAKQR